MKVIFYDVFLQRLLQTLINSHQALAPQVKINETDIGDGDSSDDGVEFDEAVFDGVWWN